MNKTAVYDAAVRSLVFQGLAEQDAKTVIARTRANQVAEWERILTRCAQGEVSKIYVVVRREERGALDAILYAPADECDNIRHVLNFASQGPNVGCEADDPNADAKPTLGFYPVSSFDVAAEVKKAIREIGAAARQE
jgi:hypothetical protein